MTLPNHKTKIVCTIGPATDSIDMMVKLIAAGMDVARLNFSHGEFESHRQVIANLRQASEQAGKQIGILADLPGPKIRIGKLAQEPIELRRGEPFMLTTRDVIGDATLASVTLANLPEVVHPGDIILLNDGYIQLEVRRIDKPDVHCVVRVGGELRSRKGLNLPGLELGISAFTDHDHDILRFALGEGVDIISQSFVDSAADIEAVRAAATALGYRPLIIAKIERAGALGNADEIIAAADGIMIARGDLGVETPISRIAVIQKELVQKAIRYGKPIITATQMLESMTYNPRPTRAEATDVANAILDGTDAVMLSGESAIGRYPVEAVAMLAEIAAETEPRRAHHDLWAAGEFFSTGRRVSISDLVSLGVEKSLEMDGHSAIIVPSIRGATARSLSRFRLPAWIAAASTDESVCRQLQLSYGVFPILRPSLSGDWAGFARRWTKEHQPDARFVFIIRGAYPKRLEEHVVMEIIDLERE